MTQIMWVLEVLEAVSLGIFVLGSYLYVKHLFHISKQRRLSTFERVMYILIAAGFVMIATKFLVQVFFV